MVDPHDSFFWQMALRSGLVDTTRLQECWDTIAPDRRTAEAIDRRLARRLIEAGYLTTWQAQQIFRGRGGGLQIGKYVLLDAIGQGGMGRVFLARDTRLNRQVALKVLSQSRLNDTRAILRFRREVRLGAQLQHENLVRIYDEGEVNGHCYLVMEYIDGSSVGHLLAGHGPMPTPTASRLARQVALGLEHARQKGMIHRDVNPYNILVTREGTAKLADLGLAIEIGDADAVTLDGALLGNYDYISPEQARHSLNLDSRSDIYSLGCTLYHMVSGQVPFPYPSLPEKLQAQLMSDPAPLSSLVPGVPKEFEEVVSRMMRKRPEERHQDPLSAAKALEPFIEGEVFASELGVASTADLRRVGGDKSLSRTEIFPFVPPTADGGIESSKPAHHSFFLSSSSSGIDRRAPALPPTEPNGITLTTISQETAPRSVVPIGPSTAHAPPPFSGQSPAISWSA
jgi:serine/threonine-protein kinase